MIVIDASAAALLFADPAVEPRAKAARAALARDPSWVVPDHFRTELFSTLRGLTLGGKLPVDQAARAVAALSRMVVTTVSTNPLLPRMWELRANVNGYDAAYVAAAEAHGCALVTADSRLARSGAGSCPIELID